MAVRIKGGDRWLLPLSGILLVMGGLLGVQVHTQSQRSTFEIGRNTSLLGEVLGASREQVDAQKKEIDQLRQRLATYEKTAVSDQGMTKVIQDELQRARIALGLVPLKGPGILLELDDSTLRSATGEPTSGDFFVVHDYDLIQLTNELWADGAEAIALNDQRLVLGSAIVCSGRLITVNHVAISAPFVFTVIGNQPNLLSALNIRDGFIDAKRTLGFQVKLTPKDEVEVPAVAISTKYQFAKPVILQ